MIDKFDKEYRFLSNFYLCKIEIDGIVYPSTEHAYQAAKTTNWDVKRHIISQKTPGLARKVGNDRKVTKLRENWDQLRIPVMRELLLIKFAIPVLRQKLLDTGDHELIESNWWKDYFFGVCNGKGENHLGKLLMEIREQIRAN